MFNIIVLRSIVLGHTMNYLRKVDLFHRIVLGMYGALLVNGCFAPAGDVQENEENRDESSFFESSSSMGEVERSSSVLESSDEVSSFVVRSSENSSDFSSEYSSEQLSSGIDAEVLWSSSSEILSSNEASSSSIEIDHYQTDFVIIAIIDGIRYTESWGHPTHEYIPRMANDMAPKGVINTQFFNDGECFTSPSHASILTGVYQSMDNEGLTASPQSSIMHHFLKTTGKENTKAFVISPKDKLATLAETSEEGWGDSFNPATYCGIDGSGFVSGTGEHYWDDVSIFDNALDTITKYHPEILLFNLFQADRSGHDNDWWAYIDALKATDEYFYQLWELIQSDSVYKDRTTLFITNDHGRHDDDQPDPFQNHGVDCGDDTDCDRLNTCDGCSHIFLYAYGPDFKEGVEVNTQRGLINIAPTVEELLEFDSPHSKAEVMTELFKNGLNTH